MHPNFYPQNPHSRNLQQLTYPFIECQSVTPQHYYSTIYAPDFTKRDRTPSKMPNRGAQLCHASTTHEDFPSHSASYIGHICLPYFASSMFVYRCVAIQVKRHINIVVSIILSGHFVSERDDLRNFRHKWLLLSCFWS